MNIVAKNTAPAPAAVPGVASGRLESWIWQWRRPTGGLAVKVWLGLLGLILLTGGVVYGTGGTGYVWVHLMYVPIVLASGVFGIRGGVVSAVAGGLVLGPFMPQDVATAVRQDPANWLFRGFFFLLVGGSSGLLFSWVNRQMERLRRTHLALVRTHEELKAAQMSLIQNAKLDSTGKYEVRTENSGAAGLAAARAFHPDFILLDVMMPGVDGGEVAAQLREDKALQNVPVVFLTAIVSPEETAPTGSSIGGCEYLAKPVKLEDLVTCIEKHLGKA